MAYSGEGGIPDIRARVYREKGVVALDANGLATITFNRPVSVGAASHVQLTPWIAAGQLPIIANPILSSWVTNGAGEYVSVQIKGHRFRDLPSPLTLLTQLIGFRILTDQNVNGSNVDWMLF